MPLDRETCYRILSCRDQRFDGTFVTAVTTTRIYCRPSCPARTPKLEHVRFYRAAAAAQAAGFRACKRCRPDASPGSPEWNVRADVVARAMRLIADGIIDREGVDGLAAHLSYSPRHVGRVLQSELGAGPLALARAQRANTARVLIETTTMPFADVAFAAGFASVRQFNDTIREVFASTPSCLRQRRAPTGAPGRLRLRLPYRAPMDVASTLEFLGRRAIPGVEAYDGTTYRRTLALPHGPGTVSLQPGGDHIACELDLADGRDLQAAVQRTRRLLDLDADPVGIDGQLGAHAALRPLIAKHPGTRVPGTVDGAELAVRAILGQQVSVSAARTLAGRLVRTHGEALPMPSGSLTHLFPCPAAIAAADPAGLGLPRQRARALTELASAVDRGELTLDAGADRAASASVLARQPGIGPWTAGYIAMRALGDPDVFLATDLGVRHGAMVAGLPDQPAQLAQVSDDWRPWRSYAVLLLWSAIRVNEERS